MHDGREVEEGAGGGDFRVSVECSLWSDNIMSTCFYSVIRTTPERTVPPAGQNSEIRTPLLNPLFYLI